MKKVSNAREEAVDSFMDSLLSLGPKLYHHKKSCGVTTAFSPWRNHRVSFAHVLILRFWEKKKKKTLGVLDSTNLKEFIFLYLFCLHVSKTKTPTIFRVFSSVSDSMT